MNAREWQAAVPETMKEYSLWEVNPRRPALPMDHLGWPDITGLTQDKRPGRLSRQRHRPLGWVAADLAQGYSASPPQTELAPVIARWVRPTRASTGFRKTASHLEEHYPTPPAAADRDHPSTADGDPAAAQACPARDGSSRSSCPGAATNWTTW